MPGCWKFWILKKSFCCCKLKTGGLIVGWLCIIFSPIVVISSAVQLAHADNLRLGVTNNKSEKVFICERSLDVIFNSMTFITSILLVVGIYKNLFRALIPWLIVWMISVGVSLADLIYNLIQEQVFYLYLQGIAMILSVYVWCIVYSLYVQMRSDKQLDSNNSNTVN